MARRKIRSTIMRIYCEGKTEKIYFRKLKKSLRISGLKIQEIESDNSDAVGILKHAINDLEKNQLEESDFIYCIFDRDKNSNKQLEIAEKLAKENNIKIAFSNPCFELWILNHFQTQKSPIEKGEILSKLRARKINFNPKEYNKYSKLFDKLEIAKKNAKENVIKKKTICRENNPLTTIYKLIEDIERFRKEKSVF